ncbi:MAG: orotate phosphoribosyltransferase [Geothrix sp.]|uniref:orotate phosphoribosyltransferase n=1 Tax=Geothrix sp. TaxID=1962974 RepID=UPI0017D003A5|nr:orotate phosphoribosyltransferase [Geothrix sp.]NWJ40981.1 orotate phosphoribosyltransferase [Geothrix sp.]WIL21022.1 MAG: orotate phosphoribosyltransferase [Geothrix sp.]
MSLSPRDFAGCLLEVGAVRLQPMDPFTWASGLKSPIYCDNRQLMGFPEVRDQIVASLVVASRALKPTLIAGAATAGVPWAAMVADRLQLPLAYVRPTPKNHGMGRQVEGPMAKGHRAVLIEDLISTGMSSLKCADALRAEGAEVPAVLALFSYGLPQAEEAFAAARIEMAVLSSFEVLSAEAEARGILDIAGSDALRAWRSDTVAWSHAHGGA